MKNGKFGKHTQCRACRAAKRAAHLTCRPETGVKTCSKCGLALAVSFFNSDSHSSDGLHTYCKVCRIEMHNKKTNTLDGFVALLFKDLTHRAKYKGLEVEISREDIIKTYHVQKGLCALTGIQMTYVRNGSEGWTNTSRNISIDRIDPQRGYMLDNVQLVCTLIGTIKWDFPQENFIEICRLVTEYHYGVKIGSEASRVDLVFHDYDEPEN